MAETPRRKGAVRRSEIPPDVLRALNEGTEETITLVEWLAIDMPTLLRSVTPQVGLSEVGDELGSAADSLADKGVTVRLRGIGEALFAATQHSPYSAPVLADTSASMIPSTQHSQSLP